MRIQILCAAALIAALSSLSFGQETHMHGGDLGSADEAMMKAMSEVKPSGDIDRDFAAMMIPHHRGAIDMAKVELAHGTDRELRALAEKIIADQEREIAELENWLSRRTP